MRDRVNRTLFAYLILALVLTPIVACSQEAVEPPPPSPSATQAPAPDAKRGETDLSIEGTAAAPTCTVSDDEIMCDGAQCGKDDKVWWHIQNHVDKDAEVLVMKLKHDGTGFYIDPLTGPGGASIHKVAVDAKSGSTPGESTLKTKVKKNNNAGFGGTYSYGVAVRFTDGSSWGDWETCIDPKVHIKD